MKKFEYYLAKQEYSDYEKKVKRMNESSIRKRNRVERENCKAALFLVFPLIVAIVVCFLLFCLKGRDAECVATESNTSAVIFEDSGSLNGDDTEASGYASIELLRENTSFVDPEVKYTHSAVFKVTYYCGCSKCCGKWSGNSESKAVGAAGVELTPYKSVAVDTSVIPLGTVMYSSENDCYIAQDTGSAIKGNRIDLFVGNHQDALKLGVNEMVLYW